jgi:hypothetical protein
MAISQATVRNDQLELQRRGFISVNLSNLTNTSVPDVVVGSAFEVGGSIYEVDTADETPTGWAGIANDNQVYIKFDASAESLVFTTTAPSYSSAKGGWYSGDDRYLARVYKDASGNARGKAVYPQWPEAYAYVPAGISGSNLPFSTSQELTAGSSWTVPQNVYLVAAIIIGAGGGGGGASVVGSNGGDTTFNSITASGGEGGATFANSNGSDALSGFVSANAGGGVVYESLSGDWLATQDGQGGEIKFRIFNVNPGESISYSIGAGGSGGSGPQNGGDGGDGIVILMY